MTDATQPQTQGPIIATAGRYYRNTRYLMAVVLVAMGAWFGYDGYVGYPKLNEKITALKQQHQQARDPAEQARLLEELKKHNNGELKTEWDIGLQKFLCFALPPVGILLLLRALHNSRGQYRLENNTLHFPGHPPVPFANITEIDRRLWDRKGIAYVSYDLGEGRQGTLRLDDFVYDRPPTDEIFKRIEQYVTPHAQSPQETIAQEKSPGN